MGPRNSRWWATTPRKFTARFATTAALATLFTAGLLTPAPSGAGQLDAVVPGRWHVFPNSRFDSVSVSSRSNAVLNAWGSGVYDTDREQLVVWGGGHTDYDGNEVYAFGPLTSDAPRWTRLTNPSTPPANNVIRGADGRPVSRHTYNLLTYLPAPQNKMMSCAVGSQFINGNPVGGVDFYDFTINGMTGQPWTTGPTAPSNAFASNAFCIFNPITNSVFYNDSGSNNARMQEYSLATRTWTSHVLSFAQGHPTPALDTRRNLLVTTGSDGHGLQFYNPATPKVAPIRVTSTGPKAIETASFPGFVYDPVNDQFVGWSGGASIYTLKVPADPKTGTWVWSQLALDAGNTVIPTAPSGTGTFGRFRYVPSQKGMIVVNEGNQPVFFFKMPNGGASLPSVSISADPTTVSASGSTTLTWSTTNARTCSAAGAWSGTKPTAGTEGQGPLTGSNTFVLTCDNGSGNFGSGSVTVSTAQAIPAPSVDLNASPPSVDPGNPVTLDWMSTSASSCTASGGWSGAKAISGSQNIGSVTPPTSFVLTCQGTGGTGSDAVTVNVGGTAPTPSARPELVLSSESGSVMPGSSLRLSWNSTGTNSCIASNGWSGAKAVVGSQVVTPAPTSSSSTYVLSCSGVGGSVERNVTVLVTSASAPTAAPAKKKGGGGAMTLSTLLMLLGVLAARHMSRRIRAQ